MFTAILPAILLTAPGADPALEPWASKAQPGDVAKSHVENITTGEHKYIVIHGGTMDGTNCRSPMGCGMNREGAIEQSWQSNRAVRMENVGQTDVIEMGSGGDPFVRKISSGVVKWDDLTIERDMDGTPQDEYFRLWFADMFQLTGTSGGSSVRRNGAIVKEKDGIEVVRFAFIEAWVVSSKFSDLEARSTNLFKQTVVMAHSGLHRL